MKIAVLAGNFAQFANYVDNLFKMTNLPKDDFQEFRLRFIYVDNPHKTKGLNIARVDTIGTFWERNDARKLEKEVQRDFEMSKIRNKENNA